MAISATFAADFSKFTSALDKAAVHLRTFEDGAAKVDTTLSRMGNKFSGTKLIQDALAMEKAIASIGGAAMLTDRELAEAGRTAAEAAEKMKRLGLEVPKGLQDLATHANASAVALTKTATSSGLLETKMIALGSALGSFVGNLGSMALQQFGQLLSSAAADGAKFTALSGSFEKLAASVGTTGDAMLTLTRDATKGLITDLDIMQSANKAMLLGLPVTAQEFSKLSEAAVTLGRAMGQDATKSMDDLITALGRSSPMILDNLGLTVKVGEANEIYAKQLGKSADALTDAEKKTAFYNAAMAAAEAKTEALGGMTLTVSDQIKRLAVEMSNLVTQVAAGGNENKTLASALGLVADKAAYARTMLSDYAAMARAAFTGGIPAAIDVAYDRSLQRSLSQAIVLGPMGKGFGPAPGLDIFSPEEVKKRNAVIELEIQKLDKAEAARKRNADAAREMAEMIQRANQAAEKSRGEQVNEAGILAIQRLAAGWSDVNSAIEAGLYQIKGYVPAVKATTDQLRAMMKAIPPDLFFGNQQASKGVSDKGIFGSLFGGIGEGFSGLLEGIGLDKGIGGMMAKLGTGISEGFGNILSGGISNLISSGVGLVTKGLGSLFGKMFGSEGKKTNDVRDSWIAQNFGSSDQLRKIATEAGVTDAALRKLFSVSKVKDFETAAASVFNTINRFNDEQAADTARLQAAVERYGFTFEELGAKLQQSKLDEQAKELIEDWRVLVAAGIDVSTVNDRMSDTMNEYLQTAIKVGAEIPAAMKPILERMVQQGVLTDEAGNAITDLNAVGIKYAETMTQGFDRIVDKLDELIQKLVGTADIIANMPPMETDLEVNVKYNMPDMPELPTVTHNVPAPPPQEYDFDGGSLPGYARGTGGRYLDFGEGTPVMLHGRERVVTEHESAGASAGMLAMVSSVNALQLSIVRAIRENALSVRDQTMIAMGRT